MRRHHPIARAALVAALATATDATTAMAARAQAVVVPSRVPLTDSERAAVDSGRQAVREEKVSNSAWPRVTVRQFVEATPQEAAAVFADYARHASYFPGIKRSAISKVVSPGVVEVDYVLDVPMYADEDYTVRDSLSGDETRGSYQVDWTIVRARSTRDILGRATFEPYRNARTGTDGTLITYVNLVVPGQLLAGPFKARALRQVRQTVIALVRRIEDERRDDPALLAAQVAALSAALAR